MWVHSLKYVQDIEKLFESRNIQKTIFIQMTIMIIQKVLKKDQRCSYSEKSYAGIVFLSFITNWSGSIPSCAPSTARSGEILVETIQVVFTQAVPCLVGFVVVSMSKLNVWSGGGDVCLLGIFFYFSPKNFFLKARPKLNFQELLLLVMSKNVAQLITAVTLYVLE